MRIFYTVFLLIVYCIACMGIGSYLYKLLTKKTENLSPLAGFATTFLIGQALLASIWLGFSLASLFTLAVIISVLLFGVCSFILILRRQIPFIGTQFKSIWLEFKNDRWEWKIIAILATLLCLAWITSLGRPLYGDGTAIYFALPKVIAASHRLALLPGYETAMYLGLQGEMHYAALMALGSADAAQLFAWPTILAGSIMLLALGRQVGLSRRGQWVVLVMVFTSSCVIWLSGDGKTDLFAASLGLAAYFWTIQTWKNKDRLSPWLVGFFAGFAVTAKFSYIPVLLPGIALIILWGYFGEIKNPLTRKLGGRNFIITSGFILAGFILAMSPHMLKNTLLFQNPIAPFGGGTTVSQVWFTAETTRRIIMTYPFALTFGSYWGQYGTLSPLLLAFLPLAIVFRRPYSFEKSGLFVCTIAALLGLIIWMVSQPSVIAPRYFMPTLLLFFLLPAKAVEIISSNKPRPQLLYFVIVFSILGTIITTAVYFNHYVFFPKTVWKYLLPNSSECDRDGEYCLAMKSINNEAALGDRVYLASFQRYWLRPDLIQCLNSGSEKIVGTSSSQYWQSIIQSGFQYLLIDHSTHTIPYLSELPSWIKLIPLYHGQIVEVYRIETSNPPIKPNLECVQVDAGAWNVDLINGAGKLSP